DIALKICLACASSARAPGAPTKIDTAKAAHTTAFVAECLTYAWYISPPRRCCRRNGALPCAPRRVRPQPNAIRAHACPGGHWTLGQPPYLDDKSYLRWLVLGVLTKLLDCSNRPELA